MLVRIKVPVTLSWWANGTLLHALQDTAGTLYRRRPGHFHLVVAEPTVNLHATTPRLLWLNIAPQSLILNMQGDGACSYRHSLKLHQTSASTYWLQSMGKLQFCNYTHDLTVQYRAVPQSSDRLLPVPINVQAQYKLRTGPEQFSHYCLDLAIDCSSE
ncbi:MAG: hypothetical protein AAFY57_09880 [Cyanobacteria bacterium J06642_2]